MGKIGTLPHEIVYRALIMGYEIEMDERTWAMMEISSGEGILCVKMHNTTKDIPHYVRPIVTLEGFVKMCKEIPDDKLFIISSNMALTEMKREEREPS